MNRTFLKTIFFILFVALKFSVVAAIIPHQGRITLNKLPYDGIGLFRFALVDQFGEVRWNHENGDGIPQSSISLNVHQGFYNCRLGDISTPGMSPLPDNLFTYDDPLSLRIWFSDGSSDLEQLGPDQPLLVAPYAAATPWTKTDEIASLLSEELDEQSNQSGTTSLTLIERIVSLGTNTLSVSDFNGSISLTMLNQDVHDRHSVLQGDVDLLDANISSLEEKLAIHIESQIERQNLSTTLTDELDSFAESIESHANRIIKSESDIVDLNSEQIVQDSKIKSLEGNTTMLQNDLTVTRQELSDLAASPIKRDQLDFTLALELDDISELNNEQQERLSNLDKNISDLSNREIAREVELNDFEKDLSGIIKKHEEQSVLIVNMERDLALHNTKDGVQDTYIDEVNDEIQNLKDADDFTDLEIDVINKEITDIMIKNTIQDVNLTKNNSNISNLSEDLSNLDGSFSAFKSLLEQYLKPEIVSEPTVYDSQGEVDVGAGEKITPLDSFSMEVQAGGKNLSYQWYLARRTNNPDGSPDPYYEVPQIIPNATDKKHEIPQANASDHEGLYHVQVSNDFGDINSSKILIELGL